LLFSHGSHCDEKKEKAVRFAMVSRPGVWTLHGVV
jgi:hypothetical protein